MVANQILARMCITIKVYIQSNHCHDVQHSMVSDHINKRLCPQSYSLKLCCSSAPVQLNAELLNKIVLLFLNNYTGIYKQNNFIPITNIISNKSGPNWLSFCYTA